MNGIKYLLKKGVIKIDPSKMSPTRSRYNLTRKEVEDIKRLVWMFYRKSEPFPEDIDI